MTPIIVDKEDLEAANKAIQELQKEVSEYMRMVQTVMDRCKAQQVEIERLRARLSEFEVQS